MFEQSTINSGIPEKANIRHVKFILYLGAAPEFGNTVLVG